MSELARLTWSRSQLCEALERLAAYGGLGRAAARSAPLASPESAAPEVIDAWAVAAGARLGVELEAIETTYRELDALVGSAAPALWRAQLGDEHEGFLAVARCSAREVTLLGPRGSLHVVATRALRDAIARPLEERWIGKVHQVLDGADVPPRRRARARSFLLREHLAAVELHVCWRMRAHPACSAARPAARAGLLRLLAKLIGAHALHYACVLGAWWTLGTSLSNGQLQRGACYAFGLLLLSALPCRWVAGWTEGSLALRLGSVLKQRLLAATFRVDTDRLRSHGTGELLARVIDTETVEALGISGGFACLLATLELSVAAWLMLQGFAAATLTGLLGGWLALLGVSCVYYLRSRTRWAAERLRTTRQLVEHMIGHRTRLAQQLPERFHHAEDGLLEGYIRASRQADCLGARIAALASRGFLLVGLGGLCAQLSVVDPNADALVLSLGALLLAQRACSRLGSGAFALFDAWIAGKNQRLPGVGSPEPVGLPEAMSAAAAQLRKRDDIDDAAPLLDMREVTFRHALRAQPVLRSCTLRVGARDHVLLQGESGGGKSTLLALLSGLRAPSSGLVLVSGLDRATLGAAYWRKFVVVAPQFHDNHVFNASFAFNVLMGTRWPASRELHIQAEAVCRELGLGELIDLMPAGMQQQLGENGWQLSHGERSRLFIARALMQDAPLVVLDESFAGLDPENTLRALGCVRARARALLVVAHP